MHDCVELMWQKEGVCACAVCNDSPSVRGCVWLVQKRMDDEIAAATEHSQRVVNMAAQRVAAEDALYAEKQVHRTL